MSSASSTNGPTLPVPLSSVNRKFIPNARITRKAYYKLHLPLFVTRHTDFQPGQWFHIRSHCHHATEMCGQCRDSSDAPGGGGVTWGVAGGGFVSIQRPVLMERSAGKWHVASLLDEIIVAPSQGLQPKQIYVADLHGRLRPVIPAEGRYVLLSIDDADRAIGAVRLSPAANRLLILCGSSSGAANERHVVAWSNGSRSPRTR